MKSVKEFSLKNKKVLLRCDFNVPLSKKREILDDFRIRETLPTIEYLIKKGAKIILMSHLSGGETLKPIAKKLEELLKKPVKFLTDCLGPRVEKEIREMKEGDIILLENLRIYKEEEENNEEFAQKLSLFGEIYINDAFGCCHRAHASIVGIPKYLPAGAGLLLEKEIKILTEILEKPERPLVVIIGGIKIETKTKVIENFLKIADHLLLGSKIGEVILIAKGILVGRKFKDEKLLEKIKEIDLTSQKLHLPVDGQMSLATLDEKYFRVGGIGTVRKEEEIFDIGPETIDIFSKIIKEAKTIIWNGPLGYFERPPFDMGTKKIVEAIIKNHRAFKVAGGGETDSFLHQSGLREKFDYVSTGGGAFLEFLSGKKLPGIEALE
jgi:phosphoglycerate kinase